MDSILDDESLVRCAIYCIEHITSGKKYVGQVRTHRLNHGRYRPYGVACRFRAHISEATTNTKHKSGHLIGVDIRQYGSDAFRVSTLEICDADKSDEREIEWISKLNTVYPNGYNLSPGGGIGSKQPVIPNPTPLTTPGAHGGSTHRTQETREKMSVRAKELLSTPEARANRAKSATELHAADKVQRFAGVTVDLSNLDQYICTKGTRAIIRIEGREASFAGKDATKEQNIERAKEFLHNIVKQTATPPNCSGNP